MPKPSQIEYEQLFSENSESSRSLDRLQIAIKLTIETLASEQDAAITFELYEQVANMFQNSSTIFGVKKEQYISIQYDLYQIQLLCGTDVTGRILDVLSELHEAFISNFPSMPGSGKGVDNGVGGGSLTAEQAAQNMVELVTQQIDGWQGYELRAAAEALLKEYLISLFGVD